MLCDLYVPFQVLAEPDVLFDASSTLNFTNDVIKVFRQ